MGFVISKNGLNIDPEKVKAIIDWPSPKNIFEVRSFHGLASFYRKFIRTFNGICVPIVETIKKDNQPFHWTTEAEKGFNLLKKRITEQPILVLLDLNKLFQFKCDASGIAIGVILSQYQKPIAYFSGKVNEAKHKYSSYDQELYAIIQALNKWRHYLMPK